MLLLVDDDELFRGALAANLRDDGYEVIEYEEGRAVRFERVRDVQAVLTDYLMGKEDGLAFAERFHAAFPEVPVVIITAYATMHLENHVAMHPYLTLLGKPLDYAHLLEVLRCRVPLPPVPPCRP